MRYIIFKISIMAQNRKYNIALITIAITFILLESSCKTKAAQNDPSGQVLDKSTSDKGPENRSLSDTAEDIARDSGIFSGDTATTEKIQDALNDDVIVDIGTKFNFYRGKTASCGIVTIHNASTHRTSGIRCKISFQYENEN